MSSSSKIGYFIDLFLIPLTMLSYYLSMILTAFFNLGLIYFFCLLFIMIHLCSSLIIIVSNYVIYHKVRGSLGLLGFGPTIVALVTLLIINLLPFLKWPFYIFKWIPHFDQWITPFIMGFFAFITQVILRKTVNDAILEADEKISIIAIDNKMP
jgi:hypothetical protein